MTPAPVLPHAVHSKRYGNTLEILHINYFCIYFVATPRTHESIATSVVTRSTQRCVNQGMYNSEMVIVWYEVN
jgi:hypothetical protein